MTMTEVIQAIDVAGKWTAICVAIPFAWKLARMLIAAGMARKVGDQVKAVAEAAKNFQAKKP
jgi:hypothetical protein